MLNLESMVKKLCDLPVGKPWGSKVLDEGLGRIK